MKAKLYAHIRGVEPTGFSQFGEYWCEVVEIKIARLSGNKWVRYIGMGQNGSLESKTFYKPTLLLEESELVDRAKHNQDKEFWLSSTEGWKKIEFLFDMKAIKELEKWLS